MADFRVIVPTPTFARSRSFYRDTLGASVVEEWPADEFQPAGIILRLTTGGCVELVDSRMAHDGLRLGVELDSPDAIDETHDRLAGAGTHRQRADGSAVGTSQHHRDRARGDASHVLRPPGKPVNVGSVVLR